MARRKPQKITRRRMDGQGSKHFSYAVKTWLYQMHGPQYRYEGEQKIRVWGDPYVECVTKQDVRAWLIGLRVVEDLNTALEFIRPEWVKRLIREGCLRKDDKADFYWITAKAAEQFELPRVMGCRFPA